jgi:hypothetical protein
MSAGTMFRVDCSDIPDLFIDKLRGFGHVKSRLDAHGVLVHVASPNLGHVGGAVHLLVLVGHLVVVVGLAHRGDHHMVKGQNFS